MQTIRVKLFEQELARREQERKNQEAKERKDREQREHYDRRLAEATAKHLRDCVKAMLRKAKLDGYVAGFMCTNVYEKDKRFVIQLQKEDGGLTFEVLDRISTLFDTKRIDVDAGATEGSHGRCESCDYGAEVYQRLSLSGAFVDLSAIDGPKFGPFRPGWFLVVADLEAYHAWVATNLVAPDHAVYVDDHFLAGPAFFWDKEVWKIVTPAARSKAPFTSELVDRLKALGYKELDE